MFKVGKTPGFVTTYCFFLDVKKSLDTDWKKWTVEHVVGNWDQEENVESGEEDDRICQNFYMMLEWEL